jgi:hypothetical protein
MAYDGIHHRLQRIYLPFFNSIFFYKNERIFSLKNHDFLLQVEIFLIKFISSQVPISNSKLLQKKDIIKKTGN